MSAEEAAEATLELTVLSPDTLKSKLKLVAWVDKRSPKTLTLTLNLTLDAAPATIHLPLPSRLLRNPSSSLTVQILSPRRLLPFRPSLLLASASLPLSSLPLLAADALALPLPRRRRGGGGPGALRVAVRVLWPLGVAAPDERPEFAAIEPSAPPLRTAAPARPQQGAAEDGAWRSFWVGLASGAIAAAAVVGVLGLSEI